MEKNKLMGKTFLWMFIGLLLTFATGMIVSGSDTMVEKIYGSALYIIFAVLELVLVIVLSARVMKMQPSTAKCVFMLYSILSGLTFSSIFIYYELGSIMFVFLVTAVIFGLLSMIGYFTKIDLSKFGTYFFVGLIGIIIVSIINIFIGNSMLDLIITIVSLVLFIGVTMYDVQKLLRLQDSGLPVENLAIYGALDLYLDFINIFLDLLRLFGSSKD